MYACLLVLPSVVTDFIFLCMHRKENVGDDHGKKQNRNDTVFLIDIFYWRVDTFIIVALSIGAKHHSSVRTSWEHRGSG